MRFEIDHEVTLRNFEDENTKEFYQIIIDNKEKLVQYIPTIQSINKLEQIEEFIKMSNKNYSKYKNTLLLGIWYLNSLVGSFSIYFNQKQLGLIFNLKKNLDFGLFQRFGTKK